MKKKIKDLIDIKKLKGVSRFEVGKYENIYIKNPYPANILIKDIKKQIKIFGYKKLFGERYGTFGERIPESISSRGLPYLPTTKINLCRKHITFNLNHLNIGGFGCKSTYRYRKKLQNYLDKRFGKENWEYRDYTIRIFLIKNVLKKNRSTTPRHNNNWRCFGTVWDKEICIQHINPPLLSVQKEARNQFDIRLGRLIER